MEEKKEIQSLVERYKIPSDFMSIDELFNQACLMADDYERPQNLKLLEKESNQLEKLKADGLPIHEIIIVKGVGKESKRYVFDRSSMFIREFDEMIRGLEFNNQLNLHGYIHKQAQIFFNQLSPVMPTKRKRLIFIWELYKIGGWVFTKQQLGADDQTKAALIKSWIFPRAKTKLKN